MTLLPKQAFSIAESTLGKRRIGGIENSPSSRTVRCTVRGVTLIVRCIVRNVTLIVRVAESKHLTRTVVLESGVLDVNLQQFN